MTRCVTACAVAGVAYFCCCGPCLAQEPKERVTIKTGPDAGGMVSAAFSADGRLALGCNAGGITLWDVKTGQPRATLRKRGLGVSGAISPDGKLLALARTTDATIQLWNVLTIKMGEEIATLNGHIQPVRALAFSPDGTLLASAGQDGKVKVWDVKTGKEKTTLDSGVVDSVAFSPDGTLLASGSGDIDERRAGTIKLWDVKTGEEKATLKGHTRFVHSVAFSPAGNATTPLPRVVIGDPKQNPTPTPNPTMTLLASAGSDGMIKLWDVKTGEEKATLKGHTEGVRSVAFSPDGALLASGSEDKTVKLWDVKTGEEKASFDGHGDTVISVAFSHDGKLLESATSDGTIQVWDILATKKADK